MLHRKDWPETHRKSIICKDCDKRTHFRGTKDERREQWELCVKCFGAFDLKQSMYCSNCNKEGIMIQLLSKPAMKKMGGGNIWWCRHCGCMKHIDLDHKTGYAKPMLTKDVAMNESIKERRKRLKKSEQQNKATVTG